jgi:hypothetical protein
MPKVVAAVVRRGRAFSGDATMRVVGIVGGGRDGPPWLFGCRAVMITCARTPGRFSVVGPLVSDGRCCLHLMRATRAARGARLPLDL